MPLKWAKNRLFFPRQIKVDVRQMNSLIALDLEETFEIGILDSRLMYRWFMETPLKFEIRSDKTYSRFSLLLIPTESKRVGFTATGTSVVLRKHRCRHEHETEGKYVEHNRRTELQRWELKITTNIRMKTIFMKEFREGKPFLARLVVAK